MKRTFGQIKTSIVNKLVDLYENENKTELKNLLKELKKNDDFKELYLFYENIKSIELLDESVAKLYVENMEPFLIEKTKNVKTILESMYQKLSDINVETDEIYECIDTLSENTTLLNLEKKVIAKNKLIQFIKTKKESLIEEEPNVFTENTKLLSAVLTNNFNTNFQKLMSEEEKQEFKKITSFSNEQIVNETDSIKKELLEKLTNLLNESTNSELTDKLTSTKEQVINCSPTKYNYYKLTQLKNGLD